MAPRAGSVPGENAPRLLAAALVVLGATSAAGAAFAWSAPPDAQPGPSSIAEPAPHAATPTAPVLAATAAAPAPVAASKPASCPAMIVVFENGFARPPATAHDPLANLGAWLATHPDVSVTIDGHADANGNEDDNLRLSRQRANSVAAALEHAGAPHAKLTPRAFGAFVPIDQAAPDAALNRRVVVQTKGDACPREHEEVIEP